uniref:Uncharacterized protein n=1 Tax=Octopus bimaculoides TaxID=37653 RepID=A0A0L8HI04_OCTBM
MRYTIIGFIIFFATICGNCHHAICETPGYFVKQRLIYREIGETMNITLKLKHWSKKDFF